MTGGLWKRGVEGGHVGGDGDLEGSEADQAG
jgi:hypothetical protein